MIEPIPIEVSNTKCFHCGISIWQYLNRKEDYRRYKCVKCGNVLVLDDYVAKLK